MTIFLLYMTKLHFFVFPYLLYNMLLLFIKIYIDILMKLYHNILLGIIFSGGYFFQGYFFTITK